jgi:hypothetical protein
MDTPQQTTFTIDEMDDSYVVQDSFDTRQQTSLTIGKVDDSYIAQPSFDQLSLEGDVAIVTPKIKLKRCQYTAFQKAMLVRIVDRLCAEGKSLTAACSSININRQTIQRWRSQMSKFRKQGNKKAKSPHSEARRKCEKHLCNDRAQYLTIIVSIIIVFIH